MDKVSLEAKSKTVLIIGDFFLESVNDKILALDHTFQCKPLLTAFADWKGKEIEQYLKQLNSSGDLLAVLMFLSPTSFLDPYSTEHLEDWQNILMEMKETYSLVYINENISHLELVDYDLFISEFNILFDIFVSLCIDYNNNQNFKALMLEIIEFQKGLDIFIQKFPNIFIFNNAIPGDTPLNIIKNRLQNLIFPYILQNEFRQKHAMYDIERILNDLNDIVDELPKFQKYYSETQPKQLQKAEQLLKIVQASGVEIALYKTGTEISLRVHHFLDEIDKGIFFHLYVPHGRYQEDQLASFLRLFESYMQRLENLQFFIEIRKTLHGQIYEFKSKNISMNLTEMEIALSHFEQFMSLCQNDQKKAEAIIVNAGSNSIEASNLLTKYIKDYQRLILDTRHELEQKTIEFEQKRLALRQRLEISAFDSANGSNLSITETVQPYGLLSLSNNSGTISINIQNPSVNINSGEQQIFEQIFNGDIQYTSEDKQLIELFQMYAKGLESISLKSQLDQLKDSSSPEVERKTAMQKIMSFLTTKVAPAIGQAGLTLLTAYLEKLLTGQ